MAVSPSPFYSSAARATYPSKSIATTIFRSAEESSTWHHRADCAGWPTDGFRVTSVPPDNGTLCPQCDRLRQLEFGPNGKAA